MLTFIYYNSLIANIEVLVRTLKVVYKILVIRKVIISLRSKVIVLIKYVLVPRDKTYFFKGIYKGAENIILNYANFVNILNNIDIIKIIFT
jgi:hypothetical protein